MAFYIGVALLVIVVAFLVVVLIRTIAFKPSEEGSETNKAPAIDQDKVVNNFVDMIRCKTVSDIDDELVGLEEFEKFRNLIIERFQIGRAHV